MKKLMIMTNGLYGGGAEKILQTIIGNIDYTKYDVTLYSLHKESIDHTQYKGAFRYRYIFSGKNDIVDKIKGWIFNHCPASVFYTFFVSGKYDIEIAFIEGESTKIISGSTNRKSQKLAWVHIDLMNNPWTEFLYANREDEEAHYRKFDKVLCVSEGVRFAFSEKFDIESKKVIIQYNPVDCKRILTLAQEKCDLSDKKSFRMIAVGRLVNQKGFDRLLRVANRLRNEGYTYELIILGDGQEREELQEYIDRNKLNEYVFLLGYKENPYCYMNNCDLIVCSSRAEGYSTVLTEGAILGLPIVSTECAGIKELFGGIECGKIVENEEDALYLALARILDDSSCLAEYKKNVLMRAKAFSLEKRMKELNELFG